IPTDNFSECVKKVMGFLFDKSSTLAFLFDEPSDWFTTNLTSNPYVTINIRKPTINTQGYVNHYILNTDNANTLEGAISYLKYNQIGKKHILNSRNFLIITLSKNVSELFEYLWEEIIYNVVVLEVSKFNFLVHQSDPCSPLNNCGKKAVAINSCSCATLEPIVFKRTNMSGCIMWFLKTDQFYNQITIIPSLKLIEYFLDVIRLHFNVTVNNYTVNSTNPYIIFELQKSGMIFFMGVNTPTKGFVATERYYTHTLVWIVPQPKQMSSVEALVHIFKFEVWIFVILSIIFTIFAWWITSSIVKKRFCVEDLCNITIQLICVSIWGIINKVPKNKTLKCIFIIYVIYVVHIQTAFTSGLIKALTTPLYDRGIEDINDLAISKLPIYIKPSTEKYLLTGDNSVKMNTIKSKLVIIRSNTNNELWEINTFRNCGGLITENLLKAMGTLSNTIPTDNFSECVKKVMGFLFDKSSTLAFLFDEPSDWFTTNLTSNPYVTINIRKPTINTQGYVNHYILNTDNANTLEGAISYLKYNQIGKKHILNSRNFLIITLSKNVSELFEYLWEEIIYNVVVLEVSKFNFLVHQSDPCSPLNNCGKKAVAINSCSCATLEPIVFKRANMSGCIMWFLKSDQFYNRITITPSLKLIEYFLDVIRLHFNVTVNHYIVNSTNLYIIFELHKSGMIFFMGVNTPTKGFVATERYYTHSLVWIVPQPKQMSSVEALVHIFKFEVWIFVILSIIFTIFAWWITSSIVKKRFCVEDLCNITIQLICVSIWGIINKVPKNKTLKCIFIIYVIYVVHIQTAFTSGLIKALTMPLYDRGIEDVNDLAISKLPIYIKPFTENYLLTGDNSVKINAIKSKLVIIRSNTNKELWEINTFRNCGGLITENLLKAMGTLSNTIPTDHFSECVKKVMGFLFDKSSTLAFLFDKPLDLFTTSLTSNPYVTINIRKPTINTQGYVNHYILNTDNANTLEGAISYLKYNQIGKKHILNSRNFLIITLSKNVSELFEYLWEEIIYNVVVLEVSKFNFLVHQSDPCSPLNNCGKKAVAINSCSCATLEPIVFKRTNMSGCIMWFLKTDQFYNQITITPSLKLIEYFIDVIRLHFNVTVNHYTVTNSTNPYILFELHKSGMICFMGVNTPTKGYVATERYYTHTLVWIVPQPKQMSSVEALVHIFKFEVWIFVILSIIFTIFAWWITSSIVKKRFCVEDLCNITIQLICVSIWGIINKVPKNKTLKCIFIIYVIYVVHIQTAFTSGLIKALTMPLYDRGIEDVNDLAISKLPIYIQEFAEHYLLTGDNSIKTNAIKNKLVTIRSKTCNELWEINNFRNCSGLITEQLLKGMGTLTNTVRVIRDQSLLRRVDEVFKIEYTNYFVHSINRLIRITTESGLMNKLWDDNSLEIFGHREIKFASQGKSVNGANLLESSDSEVEMSFHDSNSSIGLESFGEKEGLPDERYQKKCKSEDNVGKDGIKGDEVQDGDFTERAKEHGVCKHGTFFNDVYLVVKEDIEVTMWLIVGFEAQRSDKIKKMIFL
ncbi:hypothetical protein RN001_011881, partial [Aquatica leii]